MTQSDVRLRGIKKRYGKLEVIHGVDLDIEAGEFVVFVGPSGCGKTTLLRMIAGLEEISEGDLQIAGDRVNDVPSSRRGVAMVFQSYALYPHKTVYDNLAFGLKIAKVPKDEIDRRVQAASQILQISDYLKRLPKALSGGQSLLPVLKLDLAEPTDLVSLTGIAELREVRVDGELITSEPANVLPMTQRYFLF